MNWPLADRMRPRSFSDFHGLAHIKGFNPALQKLIESGHLQNMILWGPPGTGKTTFARLLSTRVDAEFLSLNAISAGAKDLRSQGELAHRRKIEHNRKTIIFVDEIHRFNKGQQDVLLPFIEKGDFVLIGATTENPSYELNSALMSRCRLLAFAKHDAESLRQIAEKACERNSLHLRELFDENSFEFVLKMADGDARRLLNVIEPILQLRTSGYEAEWPLEVEALASLVGQKATYYDKKGDQHYDVISAFIKSIRGSDADAGLYYLARMLDGGEDPVFIARRLVILASEDVSNADPKALPLAVATLQAVELIGLPECQINLAQTVTYLASAPKSNRSYVGLLKALDEVKKSGQLPVPLSLRSGQKRVLKDIGYGEGYRYSHDGPKGYVDQEFLPKEISGEKFYEPSTHGFEKKIKEYVDWLKS